MKLHRKRYLRLTSTNICDKCSRPRIKGNHEKCSRQRQAEHPFQENQNAD